VALESKSFWKPLTASVIYVARTIRKSGGMWKMKKCGVLSCEYADAQDMTEIVTGLRQLLDLRRVTQVNAQNAIVIRDTPDRLALASKIIRDIDKAKPEVLIHVQVLGASLDRLRNLGILPGRA